MRKVDTFLAANLILAAASFKSQAADKLPARGQPLPSNAPSTNLSVTPLSTNTFHGIRINSANEVAKAGRGFFGFLRLESGEIVYVVRDRSSLNAGERKQLQEAEGSLQRAENEKIKAERKEAIASGRVTGTSLQGAVDFAFGKQPKHGAISESYGQNKSAQGVAGIERKTTIGKDARLRKLEQNLGIEAPDGITLRVLSSDFLSERGRLDRQK